MFRSKLCLSAGLMALLLAVQPASAELTQRQKALIPISAFTANGDTESLRTALKNGLDNGLTISEARDALVQLYAYAGFPRSLTALTELVDLLNQRKASGIRDPEGPKANPRPDPSKVRAIGTATQTQLIGRPASGPVYDFAPEIDTYLKEHLFGDIFSSGILDHKTREIVTVSALASLPAPRQLRSHLNACLNVGLTPSDLQSFVAVLKNTTNKTAGQLAETTLQTVLSERTK